MDTSILQPCDVILLSGKNFISRGIKFFTDSKYSHAALYVGGGEGYVIEATAAGVEKNRLNDIIKKDSAYCVRRIPDLTVDQAEAMKAKAYSLIYEDYDVLQMLTLGVYFAFRKLGITWSALVSNAKNRMVCSELVAVACLCIPLKFRNKTKLVTPEDLHSTDKLVTILEAEVK